LTCSANVRIIWKGAGEKSSPKEKKCGTVWRSQAVGENRTQKRRNTGMKEYKDTINDIFHRLITTNKELTTILSKQTHFTLDSPLWSLVFFSKRTHFPHFFANFEDRNSTFTIYHSTFRRTAATKRTHFQGSRSIPASGKSPCRLSAFLIVLESLGSCVLRFLYLSKRTHFQSRRRFQHRFNIHRRRRFLNFDFYSLIFDVLSKRTHFPALCCLQYANCRPNKKTINVANKPPCFLKNYLAGAEFLAIISFLYILRDINK
jgi:hypothetical protein